MDLDDEEVPVEGLGSLRPDTSAVTLTLQSCDTGLAEPFDLTVPIPLFYGTVDPARIATKLVDKHNVPVYLYPSTEALLTACVDRRWQDCRDNYFDAALESSGRQDNANAWAEFFTKGHADYSTTPSQSAERDFAHIYQTLIHTNHLTTLLQLEQQYASNVSEIVAQRDRALAKQQQKQMRQMDQAVQGLGTTVTDQHVNQLAIKHTERLQVLEANFASELEHVKEMQRKEYRQYLFQLFEEEQSGTPVSPAPMPSSPKREQPSDPVPAAGDAARGADDSQSWGAKAVRRLTGLRSLSSSKQQLDLAATTKGDELSLSDAQRLEESFTVYLGTQRKTMHNIRLLTGDTVELCLHAAASQDSAAAYQQQAQRLLSANYLYSQRLSAVVLLVDNRLNSYSGVKREFAHVCEQSSDFHFSAFDEQLVGLQKTLTRAIEEAHLQQDNPESRRRAWSGRQPTESTQPDLTTGDFYVTKHSNLALAHVAFHLVVDNEVTKDSLNARHPTMIGMRNVIRCAFKNSIRSITIPLLLVSELTEDMSSRWCIRRAELVLKCIKGFVMENSSWGETDSHEIQFVLPKDTPRPLFEQISGLLTTVFRVSGSVLLR
eukprot:m.10553 g.10553  ORF g.10553 m.10553 type:complete len:603 (+) comp3813_c0_seq1:187-1995(+)